MELHHLECNVEAEAIVRHLACPTFTLGETTIAGFLAYDARAIAASQTGSRYHSRPQSTCRVRPRALMVPAQGAGNRSNIFCP
jgi:hypothetical protein